MEIAGCGLAIYIYNLAYDRWAGRNEMKEYEYRETGATIRYDA